MNCDKLLLFFCCIFQLLFHQMLTGSKDGVNAVSLWRTANKRDWHTVTRESRDVLSSLVQFALDATASTAFLFGDWWIECGLVNLGLFSNRLVTWFWNCGLFCGVTVLYNGANADLVDDKNVHMRWKIALRCIIYQLLHLDRYNYRQVICFGETRARRCGNFDEHVCARVLSSWRWKMAIR